MTPKIMPKPSLEDMKKEKPTEQKTPEDMAKDLKCEVDITKNPAIMEMTKLTGVGPKTAEKLFDIGYDLEGIGTGRPDEIAAQMKVTYTVAKGWVMSAQDAMLSDMKLMKAPEQDKLKKSKQFFFKTASSLFNTLLGGGVSTWAITGLSGRLASGKTQICNDITVDALSSNNYTCPKCYIKLNKGSTCPTCNVEAKPIEVVYIEPEPDTFHLDRLKEIANKRNLICNWDNLYVCPANQIPTMKAQFLQYKLIQKELERGANIHLVIVDSFNAKIRAGWSRTEMLPIRSRELAEHFNLIEYLACKYNIAWLITCQVISAPRPDQNIVSQMKYGINSYAVGGDMLLHSVNQWVSLEQVKGDMWEATLFDSSYLPKKTIGFQITVSGIKDGIH